MSTKKQMSPEFTRQITFKCKAECPRHWWF